MNGQKTWISAAHLADHILVVGRSDSSGSKHEGMTMISVPTDSEGIEINGIQTMGGKEVNDVFLTDCRVPADRMIGTEGGGWLQLMAGLNVERLILAATALGIAQRAFDDVLEYIKERQQFGRPIGTFQTLKHRIADLATELECTRLLVYDVARKVDADPNQLLPREASMAKLKATELAKQCSLEGMQDDGRLRLRVGVRHGTARPRQPRDVDLRRDERDPAGDRRQDVRPVEGPGRPGTAVRPGWREAAPPAAHRASSAWRTGTPARS